MKKRKGTAAIASIIAIISSVYALGKFDFVDAKTNDLATKTINNLTRAEKVLTPTISTKSNTSINETEIFDKSGILTGELPKYTGRAYVEVNGNKPIFDTKESNSFEKYSEMDEYGRPCDAIACIGLDIMPREERGPIGMIKPPGWVTIKYNFIDGKYLYNRCHLIGYQISGENSNTKNLITGTRYLNTKGMLPFENRVAKYINRTNNHVLYRVTPIYKGSEKIARGVQIQAYSVEDKGRGISFNVYCFNVQPGVIIDYETGESRARN